MTNQKNCGIYIHIPFCLGKCLYCNFYSVYPTEILRKRYIERLCEEIKQWGERTACPIDTLYIGGGTPSVLSGAELKSIFDTVRDSFKLCSDAEITCEVNPGDNTERFLKNAAELGVNRISIGVQSFSDLELKTLGRRHSVSDAEKTVEAARKLGFKNLSADIMISLPDSNRDTLQESLDGILSLDTEHISAYILKIEDGTPLSKMKLTLPSDDQAAEQYLQMCDTFKSAGYEHYEISNFAKKGFQSRHNNRYWLCEEYIGIGPAAHSFFEGKRFFYPESIEEFIAGAEPVFDGEGGDEDEFIMLALRLSRGLRFDEYEVRFGKKPENRLISKAKLFEKNGLCKVSDVGISLTAQGMLVSNAIISQLIGEK